MTWPELLLFLYGVLQWVILLTLVPVVLTRMRTPASGIAWLLVIFLHPPLGLVLYILFGTHRLRHRRVELQHRVAQAMRSAANLAAFENHARTPQLDPLQRPLVLAAQKLSNLPIVGGNTVAFTADSPAVVRELVADIDAAREYAHLLFYIFGDDQTGNAVADALVRAARRGVTCRLLVDELGSRPFFRTGGLADRLRAAGVHVAKAMPLSRFRRYLTRVDLRNHRKIAVLDGQVAWAGSQNMINADYGGKRGGPWFDAMGRFHGPIVAQLHLVFLEDWACEADEALEASRYVTPPAPAGDLLAQVVATGPDRDGLNFHKVLIAAMHAAQRDLVITTPYFIPDEPTLLALTMAADRGVRVTLILPERSDQFLVGAASRAYYAPLLAAGVEIWLFQPGLVHTKSTVVDDAVAIFGSANMDIRSFSLNFEVNLLLFGSDVTGRLRALQQRYLADSRRLDPAEWAARPRWRHLTDKAIALLSPVL